jgi:hypothetical protein
MSIKEQLRQTPEPDKPIIGQDIDAPLRFVDATRHMIVFDVLTWDCPVGGKGERIRIFLTDEGYKNAQDSAGRGEIKIVRHARVRRGELFYDASERDHEEY